MSSQEALLQERDEARAQAKALQDRIDYLGQQIGWEPGHFSESLLGEVTPESYALALLIDAHRLGKEEGRAEEYQRAVAAVSAVMPGGTRDSYKWAVENCIAAVKGNSYE